MVNQITPVSALEEICVLRKEGSEPVPLNATAELWIIQTGRTIAHHEAAVTQMALPERQQAQKEERTLVGFGPLPL